MSLSSLSADGRAFAARGQTNMDSDRIWRWAAFGPALVLMVAMAVLPLANLFLTSFYDVAWSSGQASWTPVGLAHYPQMLTDPLLKAGVVNTTLFAVGAVGGQMVVGSALAVLVSRIERGRVFFRAVFILPILIPGIVIGAIWKLMLNFDFGLVNQAWGSSGFRRTIGWATRTRRCSPSSPSTSGTGRRSASCFSSPASSRCRPIFSRRRGSTARPPGRSSVWSPSR